MMRRVGGRSYARRRQLPRDKSEKAPGKAAAHASIELDPGACMWRTWYSNLVQMISTFSREDAAKIRVIPLPGDVTVAGEWFLGIPAHSAAPDVGLRLIRNLTTREAELDRMSRGVGLPTRQALYDSAPPDAPISESFRLSYSDLRRLLAKPFRRSRFACYGDYSDSLSVHLKAIMDLQSEDRKEIARLLNSAILKASLIQGAPRCPDCHKHEQSLRQIARS
jgi:hypothetical protein